MSNVLVKVRIFPKQPEILEDLKKDVEKNIVPEKIEVENLAFGIKVLIISKVVEDKEGEVFKLEERIKNLKSVGEAEVIETSRMI